MMPSRSMSSTLVVAALVALGGAWANAAEIGRPVPPPSNDKASADAVATPAAPQFQPPDEGELPDNEFGALVRRGRAIFTDTKRHAGAYVGNDLSCSNCHLDAGRLRDSSPLWAAYVRYPQFRNKTKSVDNFAERLRGCFVYSMNGKAPPHASEPLVALEAYSFWLATGAPVNKTMAGAGYPKLERPAQSPDYARGREVYEANCAVCHGSDGQGQRAGGEQVFPPLWGPRSYNWGAGMHQLNNAAAFIHANMPLGRPGLLSAQQAWDVAYYMNAHERPQDPRYTGSVAETRKKFHDTPDSLYGLKVNGKVLGSGTRAK
jgi:thiosulfate dehydrogenase